MPESIFPAVLDDATNAVGEALRFERLLSDVSSSFIELPIGLVDEAIDEGLRRIVAVLAVDRSTLSSVDPRTGQFHATHSQAATGFAPVPASVSSRTYPWALARFRSGLPVVFSRLDELPPEAATDAASYASIGLRSHVGVPVMVSGEFMAVLGFAALRHERSWPDALVERMRLLGEIFGSALARKRAQDRIDELLGFEHLVADVSTSLLDASDADLDARMNASLQTIGGFLGVDRMCLWTLVAAPTRMVVTHQWIADPGMALPGRLDASETPWIVGEIAGGRLVALSNLADVAPAARTDAAALAAHGVRSFIALPLMAAAGGAGVISLSCVRQERVWPEELLARLGLLGRTLLGALARRRIERQARDATLEAAAFRERLAHLARVDAVGAMSAAIAHEVNQPLTAIVNYAQAGRRRLAGADALDRARLDDLLEKIGGQASLAGEVLDRLRETVKRRDAQEAEIDVPRLIGRALRLIEIESRMKDTRVESSVAPGLPPVLGDEIQLQQVIMNLAHNAMDAMVDLPAGDRLLRLEASASGDGGVLVAVIDRGPGVPDAETEAIFEPFYTTRDAGLGIGLPISRSIVEAHGGKLWCARDSDGGSVFQFTLPSATAGA